MKIPRPPMRITPGFAFSYVERAILEGLAARRFGKQEIEAVLEFFGKPVTCVYCGDPQISRWDHLIAVKQGGQTVLGNMVPACSRCDDSKQHLSFDTWIASDAKHSPKSRGVEDVAARITKLRAYASHFGYSDSHPEWSLPLDQKRRLEDLRRKIAELRREVDSFLATAVAGQ